MNAVSSDVPVHVSHMNRRNAMTRWVSRGLAVDPNTDDLRELIKREIWLRGKTIKQLALSLGMNEAYFSRVLSNHGNRGGSTGQRITPGFLQTLITHLHVTPAVARRMHLLGARAAGWKL